MGWFSDVTGGILDPVSDELAGVEDAVNENWVDIRDGLQTAAVIVGNYYLPGSSALTSQLVTKGAQENLNSDLGRVANTAAGVSGGMSGNASNYGRLGEAAGITSGASSAANTAQLTADAQFLAADASQLAAQGLSQSAIQQNLVAAGVNSFAAADAAQLALQGIPPDQMSTLLTQSSGTETIFSNPAVTSSLSANQINQLTRAGIQLAGIAGAANALDGDTGGLGLTQQDRSGFSSGSANYSPEYYQQIQSKYNQYMPQARGADITTDLKNWYETKYTPGAAPSGTSTTTGTGNAAGTPTLTTTGTGYSTPTTLTNLGITPQTVAPTYSILNPRSSTATNVATEYANFIATRGGNTPANRAEAIQYLQTKGFSGPQIDAGYNAYLATLPASTGTTAETMAANATPAQIAQAYGSYAAANGGDNQANQAAAIQYLQRIGVPYATIEAAYPLYKASLTQAPATGGGMLTGGGATNPTPALTALVQANAAEAPPAYAVQAGATQAQPLYSTLSASSNPQAIADAYKQFTGGVSGDTKAKQEEAIAYLSNLGVDQGTINQAYGLFKG